MLPIQYTYLFGVSLYIIPWLVIYIKRKDLRALLIQLGLVFSILGIICEYFWWTNDWWKPYTITNTTVGIEDFIAGFCGSGVAASLFIVLRKKRFIHLKSGNKTKRLYYLCLALLFNLSLFAFLFALKVNSFYSTLIALSSGSIMVLLVRRDLIFPSVISGFLSVITSLPFYAVMITATPNFIERTWFLKNLSSIYFLGVPIEDFIFFFLAGLLCFSVYPYYVNVGLSKD